MIWGFRGIQVQLYCTSLICFLAVLLCVILIYSFFPHLEASALVEKIVLDIPCEAKGSSGCPLLSYLPVPALQLTRGDKGLQGPPQGGRVSTAGERVEHETACVK